MMAVHKISNDFYEESFTLLGIRSSMKDFAVAYALNETIKSKFKRCSKDLALSEELSFPTFEWKDENNDDYWTLITNSISKEEALNEADLFANEPSFMNFYVLAEHKDADYLLKIEHDHDLYFDVLKALQEIPKIVTAYAIEIDNLKSKTNLIYY